jgi:hypothetical protein
VALDPWTLLELALKSLPAVATSVQEALNEGKYDEATAKRVKKILPTTGESEKAVNTLKARKKG